MKRATLIISAMTLAIVTAATGLDRPATVQAGQTSESQTAASERTVTFVVEKMTCAACPITVRTAIQKVDGVRAVSVDFKAGTATVVFDPAITTPEEISTASTSAGYPAAPAR